MWSLSTYLLSMADSNQIQIDLLKMLLEEVKKTNEILQKFLRSSIKESKENAKQQKKMKMLLEAKKILETPSREAMILEEMRKRGYKL